MTFLKLINYNSSNLTEGYHDHDGDDVWMSDLNKNRILRIYFSVFSPSFSSD